MKLEEKPEYILYIIGIPEAVVEFYPEAARQLGVNLVVEYHGCIIETLFSDGHGLVITDAAVETLRIEEENRMAEAFYKAEFGFNWFEKIRKRALELLGERKWEDDLPF